MLIPLPWTLHCGRQDGRRRLAEWAGRQSPRRKEGWFQETSPHHCTLKAPSQVLNSWEGRKLAQGKHHEEQGGWPEGTGQAPRAGGQGGAEWESPSQTQCSVESWATWRQSAHVLTVGDSDSTEERDLLPKSSFLEPSPDRWRALLYQPDLTSCARLFRHLELLHDK